MSKNYPFHGNSPFWNDQILWSPAFLVLCKRFESSYPDGDPAKDRRTILDSVTRGCVLLRTCYRARPNSMTRGTSKQAHY